MNIDNFFIEESEIELAKEACNGISDSFTRSRCVANILATSIAQKYFTEYSVDIESSIHRIPQISNKIDIADIYVNNSYIDVRLYFENETIKIPRYNYDTELLPVAYLAIKFDNQITNATVMGFATPDIVSAQECDDKYFYLTENSLVSFYDIQTLLDSSYNEDAPSNYEELAFDYLDGKIQDPRAFYKALISSKAFRNYLKDVAKMQAVFENLFSSKDETSGDGSLMLDQEEVGDTDPQIEFSAFEENTTLDDDSELIEDLGNSILASESIDNIETIEQALETDSNFDLDNESTPLELHEDFSTSTTPSLSSIEENEEGIDSVNEDIIIDENYSEESFEIETSDIEQADILEENLELEGNFDNINKEEELNIENIEADNITSEIEIVEDIETENNPIEVIEAEDELANNIESVDIIVDKDNSIKNNEIDSSVTEDNVVSDTNEDFSDKPKDSIELDALFDRDESSNNQGETDEFLEEPLPNKKSSKAIPIIGALVICAAIGYFGFTKFNSSTTELGVNETQIPSSSDVIVQQEDSIQKEEPLPTDNTAQKEEALMPIETVENIKQTKPTNEGVAISIPTIEQNLGVSIDVANLTVKWEVPSTYLTNNTANKYFTKIGKIIQLNLKTEMLLLNKSPITNKIMVELGFNKNSNKFDVKGVTTSSGEQVIDDLIVKTVKNALDLNLKMNLDVFNNLPGNPVLIIRL